MRKKSFSIMLTAVLTVSLLLGCSSGSSTAAEGDTEEASADEISTVGPEDATHLEMWTFVELHSQFYADMLEQWNEENPDKQFNITFTTYPYADMHSKLTLALQSGEGAPDLCDIEIGQFPNYLKGEVPFLALNDYIEPYKDELVEERMDNYAKDGTYYGVPTHVGATVMYYNTKILEEAGVDYHDIVTWDDYTEAGKMVYEATNGEVKMTSVDTSGTDWLWIAMAEYGEDWTDDNGKPNIELESIKNMITMQQKWITDNVAMVSPGGQTDMEEGYANISDGNIASFPKAMWYMSRFLNYMPEMSDTWAIAPCPVFKEGQPRSVGIGGTGTVVSSDSENAELAAEFLTWAKLSYDGNVKIWEDLGFDTTNTSIWEDTSITQDTDNQYLQYFVTNPFDTLNEIKDEIGMIKPVTISPTILDQFNTIVLTNCLESGADVEEQLQTAQEEIDLEYDE